MRKVIMSMNITLDGFMAGPAGELDWHFPFWTEEMAEYACEQLSLADTILLGRRTYEAMASYWPYEGKSYACSWKEIEYANRMNNYSKIVFSKTLRTVEWNNTKRFRGNIGAEVIRLKQQPGMDIITYGSGSIATSLARLGLIDEYALWVHPVVIGQGIPLFKNLYKQLKLKLVNTHAFGSGVVLLCYETLLSPGRKAAERAAVDDATG